MPIPAWYLGFPLGKLVGAENWKWEAFSMLQSSKGHPIFEGTFFASIFEGTFFAIFDISLVEGVPWMSESILLGSKFSKSRPFSEGLVEDFTDVFTMKAAKQLNSKSVFDHSNEFFKENIGKSESFSVNMF